MFAQPIRKLGVYSIFALVCLVTSATLHAQNRGSFVGPVAYSAGAPTVPTNTGFLINGVAPLAVVGGDVNGDGTPDLVVAASCAGFSTCPGYAVLTYLGNGDGTFKPPVISGNLPPEVRSIVAGDFNSDGKLDVAVAADCLSASDCSGASLTVFLGNGDGTFTQSAQYTLAGPVGVPNTLAVGHFRQGGNLDLVAGIECYLPTVNLCSVGAVAVYLGNGDGTLGTPTYYTTVGNNPLFPLVGDFNGDGKLDVVTPNAGANVTVLLGNGDGTFTASDVSLTSSPITGATFGDFNGDTKLDLAFNTGTGQVEVAAGNGDGTFQTPVMTQGSLGNALTDNSAIVAVDMNGDGKLDLVATGTFSAQVNGVQIFLNDGTGNFQAKPAYPLGGWLSAPIVTGDFNSDGKTDVLVVGGCSESTNPGDHCPDGSIVVLLGNGDGTMQGPTIIATPSGGVGVNSVGVADFNGDGIPDLFVSSGCSPATGQCGAAVLLGQGAGTYQSAAIEATGALEPFSSLSADFNGDGKADLAILNQCDSTTTCNSPSVSISLGNGDGTFQPPVTYPVGGTTAVGIVTGDFRAVGKADLAVATQCDSSSCTQGTVSILLGNGDGTFQNANTTGVGAGSIGVSIAAGIFNNTNKRTDLVMGTRQSFGSTPNAGFATILLSNGDGTLTVGNTYSTGGALSGSLGTLAPATGDVNGDGNVDIVIGNACESNLLQDAGCSNGSFGVLLGNGDGTFQPVTETIVTDGNLVSANLVDVDVDGKLDLIASTTGGLIVARGNGDGTFQTPVTYGGLGESNSQVVAVADLNKDGAPDIVQPNILGNLAIFYNRGGDSAVLQLTTNPVIAGQPVNVNVTVVGVVNKSLVPTGSVTLSTGKQSLATAALTAGTASITVPSLSAGSYTVTASYAGDTNFNPQTSAPVTFTVASTNAPTTTAVSSSTNPSTFGQSLTLTATVTSSGGTPSGTITFLDGTTTIGTAALSGGSASISTSTLTAGSHSITASYGGATGFLASSSGALAQVVNKATPAITWGTPAAISYGTPLSSTQLNATANVAGSLAYSPVPGTVLGAGVQTLSVSFTPSDANDYVTASTSVLLTVNQAPSQVTLGSSANPSGTGQSVSFAASIAPQFGGKATGTITFSDGATALATVPVTANAAIFATSALTAGTHSISATYSGDTNVLAATSNTISQVVSTTSIATTTTLSSSANPAYVTQSITYTATVSSASGVPTGSVSFRQGAAIVGSASLVNGQASFTTSYATSGTRSITAVYAASAPFLSGTSAALRESVRNLPAATTTALASLTSPSLVGQEVTFSAKVVSTFGPVPNGEVVTFVTGAGVVLGSSPLSNGLAELSVSTLTVGTHNIRASYPGDGTFAPSTSPAFSQTVLAYQTSTSVTSSLNPSAYGQPVSLTATVTSAGPATPTGTVVFTDGTTTLARVALNSSGAATLTRSNLPAGTDSITATYLGDSESARSVGQLSQVVNQATTSMTLTSSPNPSALGRPVTFTVTVNSPTTTPTGAVTFTSGASTLGTVSLGSGRARFVTSSLPRGTDPVVATYGGNANAVSASATLTQQVN